MAKSILFVQYYKYLYCYYNLRKYMYYVPTSLPTYMFFFRYYHNNLNEIIVKIKVMILMDSFVTAELIKATLFLNKSHSTRWPS